MKLLVTGGAGYIGSVATRSLLSRGHQVTVLDDLSTGHRDAVPDGVELVVRDITRAAGVFARGGYEGVVHFAAKSLVGESMSNPSLYWHNNVVGSRGLLDAMTEHRVPRLVFPRRPPSTASPRRCRS